MNLLLGLAAAKRGTMEVQTTKLLSCYLECLLPPTSTELTCRTQVEGEGIWGLGAEGVGGNTQEKDLFDIGFASRRFAEIGKRVRGIGGHTIGMRIVRRSF